MQAWQALWEVATDEIGGPATISVDPDDPYTVLLTWPDGSKMTLLYSGVWRCTEEGPPYDAATATGMYDP